MRYPFMNGWAWVCFVGLMLVVAAVAGFRLEESMTKIAARFVGIICGLAIIVFGILMNARWLLR